jgi:hypothetical protein
VARLDHPLPETLKEPARLNEKSLASPSEKMKPEEGLEEIVALVPSSYDDALATGTSNVALDLRTTEGGQEVLGIRGEGEGVRHPPHRHVRDGTRDTRADLDTADLLSLHLLWERSDHRFDLEWTSQRRAHVAERQRHPPSLPERVHLYERHARDELTSGP